MYFFSCLQVLFNQFKYFYNLYFLLLACSQFIKELRLGALYTYWVPLVCGRQQRFYFSPIIVCCQGHLLHNLCQVSLHIMSRQHVSQHLGCNSVVSALQGFVLTITIIREAVEEIRCYVRDKEVNSQIYSKLSMRGKNLKNLELKKYSNCKNEKIPSSRSFTVPTREGNSC